MPVYEKRNSKGEVVPGKYRIVISVNGKPKEEVIEAKSRRLAEKYESEEQRKHAAVPRTSSVRAPKFSDFCLDTYSPAAALHLRKSTSTVRKYTLAILIDHFGNKPIDRITADDVVAFQKARTEAGIGPVKINDDVSKLLTILRFAEGRAPYFVPKVKRLPPLATKGRVKVWTEAEIEKLYAALNAECPHLLPITIWLINTGMRKGEALAAEWSWVDLKRRMISVQPNEWWRPKDNEPREVTISDALLAVLKKQRLHPRLVFPTLPDMLHPQGEQYTAWPQNQWDRARRRAGIGGSPHVCRHTFASHFLANGGNLSDLARILGHSTTKVTDIYSHLVPGHLEKTRNVVNIGPKFQIVKGGK